MKKPARPKAGSKVATVDQSAEGRGRRQTEALETLVELLPPEEQGVARQIIIQSKFSGPLPPPALFAEYDAVLPGSAERIMAITEREQSHRHQWETSALQGELRYGSLGLIMAGTALAIIVAGVVGCAALGAVGPAIGLTSLGAVGIIGAFVQGRVFPHGKRDEPNGGKSEK